MIGKHFLLLFRRTPYLIEFIIMRTVGMGLIRC
jgi:hypothetical protein